MKTSNPFSLRLLSLTGLSLLGGLLVACAGPQPAPQTLASGAGCHQVAENDPVLQRFYQPGAVTNAEPIQERVFHARAIQPVETRGAKLYVRAEPNLTAPYLRRVLACHAEGNSEAHPNDPLRPTAGRVTHLAVSELKNGFAVHVGSDSSAVGEEIWQRAEAMTQERSSVEVEQVAAGEPAGLAF